MIGEDAPTGGDVAQARAMNEGNREIATGGENLGSSAGAQAATVNAEGDIADIVQAILDAPVAANQRE